MKIKNIKSVLLFVAFCACMTFLGHMYAEQGDFSTLGYDTPNGYSFWRVDSSGYLKPGVASLLDIGTAALPVRTLYVGGITATGAISATSTVALSTVTMSGVVDLMSKTQANAEAVAIVAGGIFYCSDCTVTPVCISTGGLHGLVSLSNIAVDCD